VALKGAGRGRPCGEELSGRSVVGGPRGSFWLVGNGMCCALEVGRETRGGLVWGGQSQSVMGGEATTMLDRAHLLLILNTL
jgi:hypothetical protein